LKSDPGSSEEFCSCKNRKLHLYGCYQRGEIYLNARDGRKPDAWEKAIIQTMRSEERSGRIAARCSACLAIFAGALRGILVVPEFPHLLFFME
jgi:hypothetical protein